MITFLQSENEKAMFCLEKHMKMQNGQFIIIFVNESNNADMHILHFKLNFVKYLLVLKLKMQFQMSFLILIKSKNEQC